MTTYIIRDRETGTFIDRFASADDARAALAAYEEEDRKDGSYTPDFYEIVTERVMSVRDLRLATGLTQCAFADRYSIPKRTLENWEHGVNECPEYTRLLLDKDVRDNYYTGYISHKYHLRDVYQATAINEDPKDGPESILYTVQQPDDPEDRSLIPEGCEIVFMFKKLWIVKKSGSSRPRYPSDFRECNLI